MTRFQLIMILACAATCGSGGVASGSVDLVPDDDQLVVTPGVPLAASIKDQPVDVRLVSSSLDRLTLTAETAERLGVKPAFFFGRSTLSLAGKTELKGKSASVDFAIGGKSEQVRAAIFERPLIGNAQATVGPWGVPQKRVIFRLPGEVTGASVYRFGLYGDADSAGVAAMRLDKLTFVVAFDVDHDNDLPILTAALGAELVKRVGGTVSGPSWDIEIAFGIKRPVRRLTLAEPLLIGPFRFTSFAVRVRDRVDAGGVGGPIRDADETGDPAEIDVTARRRSGPLLYSIDVPRAALERCARLSFDKKAKRIELLCRPTLEPGK